MTFVWPGALLGIVAAIVFFLMIALGTRAARFPLILFTGALICLSVAAARPSAVLDVPRIRAQVMLVFDTSSSMAAEDVDPNRLEFAKSIATTFVEERGSGIDVGIVSFGDGGVVTLPPTDETPEILAAIERLQPLGGTSIVEGVQAALDALTEGPLVIDRTELAEGNVEPLRIDDGSAAIVVFSDGEETNETDPTPMVNLAASSAVQVHAVGVGTVEGTTLDIDGFSLATALNEESLQNVAEVGNGTYFAASDDAELSMVGEDLNKSFIVEPEDTELSAIALVAALLLAVLGALVAQRRTGRLP